MNDLQPEAEQVDILLVEDNPGDVRLTREAFNAGQIDTTLHVVTDGVEALEFLRQHGDYTDAPEPDVVLLDLNLPRKDGDEVLAEIRDDPALKRIPVIVLTSSSAEEDVRKSYELQANAFLTKPVDPAKFVEVLESFEQFWISTARFPPSDEN